MTKQSMREQENTHSTCTAWIEEMLILTGGRFAASATAALDSVAIGTKIFPRSNGSTHCSWQLAHKLIVRDIKAVKLYHARQRSRDTSSQLVIVQPQLLKKCEAPKFGGNLTLQSAF